MSTLRLLHAADLHLDSPFESLSAEKAEARRAGQRELLKKISATAQELGVQAVLLSGDVFDSDNVSADTQREFIRSCGALSCPVLVSPGNHDPYRPGCIWQRIELPPNVHVFTGEIESVELPGIEARFWGAAFTSEESAPLLHGFATEKSEIPNIMVLHGEVGAGESKYNPISRGELEISGMDYVALGHIHGASGLQKAGRTFYANPGCTEGRGYDETGVKGALLVTISDGAVEAKTVPLGGVRYEVITLDITGKDALEEISSATAELTANDCCRIVLKGETKTPVDLPALRNALAGKLFELQLRDETTLERDLWALAGENTLRGVFIKKLREKYDAAGSDEEKALLQRAASYGTAAIENEGDKL